MVNMPLNVSAFPMDELGLETDINQNINQEYYEWLLKQHNYFPDCAFHKEKFEDTIKMEHSYTRDWKPSANCEVMATRTILVERPPLCPSCHQLPPNHDEKVDTPEAYNIPIPPYNEEAGRRALNATEDMIKFCHNRNSDNDDWTQSIQKHNWTEQQLDLFERVERILDMDQLGRLAVSGLSNECLRRNAIIEKSVSRMRAALAAVHWEPRLTSWLHGLLMTTLPPKYMVSYIDILQTLKRKIPTLVDKMLYHKPIEMHKDYMSAIMKRAWEPTMVPKTRTLPSNPVIIVVSSTICAANTSSREKRWLELLGTLTAVETITVNLQAIDPQKPIEQVTEHLVAMTRAKIQEVRNQTPNRHVILAGFNAGAAIALQVALVESVNSIVCLGFAFNTLHGVRGMPDDKALELTTPILFVIGQNAQRSSQEEIESLREKMSAQTLLVIVGSSDDSLRVKRLNRSMEGVSQSMIDNMIMDEIQEFATSCILNPPGPRKLKQLNGCRKVTKQRATHLEHGPTAKRARLNGNQRAKLLGRPPIIKTKNGIQNGNSQTNETDDDESLQLAFKSVLPTDIVQNDDVVEDKSNGTHDVRTTPNGSPSIKQKVKYIPPNQFLHIKPPPLNTQKIYVKQQNGNQSYTLGVKNIGTTDVSPTPVVHNKLVSPKNKEQTTSLASSSPQKKTNVEYSNGQDRSIKDIDIFDIPILFADKDGNIIDENHTGNSDTPKTSTTTINSIDVISEEIVNDTIIDESMAEPKDSDQTGEEMDIEKPTTPPQPPKPLTRSGNFVVLNKHNMSQFKKVKCIPASKIRKVVFPRGNIRCFNASGRLSSIDSKPRFLTNAKTGVPKFQNFTRLLALQHNQQSHTNGESKSGPKAEVNGRTSPPPKSGILIKRNHMKNITVRKVNVVQSSAKKGNAVLNGSIDSTVKNNIKDNSIASLVADLED
ncbi:uncharacterized protein LOC129575237 isoform X2 [Sitodiplosis mosellana]|uniref:uncharacterized protein LOC129575237 isoform X2 n=1 Tax=Sitodiplosis mosellana TaxID=263140 RepID=UPI002445027F|nr:uncharacterized protein LOC129575237 isoform X2 [Sitodiplosis mosellana]